MYLVNIALLMIEGPIFSLELSEHPVSNLSSLTKEAATVITAFRVLVEIAFSLVISWSLEC